MKKLFQSFALTIIFAANTIAVDNSYRGNFYGNGSGLTNLTVASNTNRGIMTESNAQTVAFPPGTFKVSRPVMGFDTWNSVGTNYGASEMTNTFNNAVSDGAVAMGFKMAMWEQWQSNVRDANGNWQPKGSRQSGPTGNMTNVFNLIRAAGGDIGIYIEGYDVNSADKTVSAGLGANIEKDVNQAVFGFGATFIKADSRQFDQTAGRYFEERVATAVLATGKPVVVAGASVWDSDGTQPALGKIPWHGYNFARTSWRCGIDIAGTSYGNDSWGGNYLTDHTATDFSLLRTLFNFDACASFPQQREAGYPNDMDAINISLLTKTNAAYAQTIMAMYAIQNAHFLLSYWDGTNTYPVLTNFLVYPECVSINQDMTYGAPFLIVGTNVFSSWTYTVGANPATNLFQMYPIGFGTGFRQVHARRLANAGINRKWALFAINRDTNTTPASITVPLYKLGLPTNTTVLVHSVFNQFTDYYAQNTFTTPAYVPLRGDLITVTAQETPQTREIPSASLAPDSSQWTRITHNAELGIGPTWLLDDGWSTTTSGAMMYVTLPSTFTTGTLQFQLATTTASSVTFSITGIQAYRQGQTGVTGYRYGVASSDVPCSFNNLEIKTISIPLTCAPCTNLTEERFARIIMDTPSASCTRYISGIKFVNWK